MTNTSSDSRNKPQIHLSLNQVGIIIIFDSGVIYHNQTGGGACGQRYQEGVLLLPTDPELVVGVPGNLYQCPIDRAFRNMEWSMLGISNEQADEIDALLKGHGFTQGIALDRSHLSESEEAWIYVTLEPLDYAMYSGFGSCRGVLVWANSD